MFMIIVNPDSFQVNEHVFPNTEKEDFVLRYKETPPNKDVYALIMIKDISKLNFPQIVQMIYSDDAETRDMIIDQLKHYDDKEDLETS